ncbi:hypothetical protein BHE74_00021102 [Ensete ventricosum]|nr:hypothetical protein BHE74_00021102 [Ensete ventricosum]
MGESPFSLVFGTKAVLPPKVVYPTFRVESYEESASVDRLRENLDLLEERSVEAHLRALTYKKVVARLYDRKVCSRQIKIGDMVLRKAEVSNPTRSQGKLARTGKVLAEWRIHPEKGLIP